MRSLLLPLLTIILPLAHASPQSSKPSALNPTEPIYLGDVFWPPTMTFIAWLPSDQQTLNDWCYHATDASDHRLFSLGGIDALEIHNYFDEQAYLTREGRRFADCWITPESGRMGACEGVADWECADKHKFTGPGTKRWSCWVVSGERRDVERRWNATMLGQKEELGAAIEGGLTSVDAMKGTKTVAASVTPGATGS